MYVCMYVCICLRRLFIYMAANEADVDLRPVNNTMSGDQTTTPQHRELRALYLFVYWFCIITMIWSQRNDKNSPRKRNKENNLRFFLAILI